MFHVVFYFQDSRQWNGYCVKIMKGVNFGLFITGVKEIGSKI